MVSCASCGYSLTPKHKNDGVTFHSFPKNQNRRTKWVDFVKSPEFSPKNSSVLCSRHFSEDCFDRSSKLKVRLQPNAVPTIEVDRLKYVRLCNPIVTRVIEDVGSKLPDHDSIMPGPSVRAETTSPQEDSPRKKILKRKIADLRKNDRLKNYKIRRLQKNNWRQKKQISSLKTMTLELKKRNILLEEHENVILEHFGKNKDIIQRLLKKSKNKSMGKSYEHSVRAFAVTLHFFSPKAYTYVRKRFENSLPHPKTLAKWYSTIDAKPGFSSEAFDFLKFKVKNSNNKKIFCSLVFDEIAIRKHLESVGSEYYGYVNCGSDLYGDSVELANEALVFLIVCINEPWKLPIGYFFIAGINSQQKASLVKQALILLKEVGIIVTNITFDGCATNFSMCKLLNCHFDKTNIRADFTFENGKYFLLPDPVHMIKLVRNCFGEKKKYIDIDGELINFEFVVELNNLQEQEGLHLATKLRKTHINFFKQKMKVKLATQLLSRSVSEALLYCRDKLHLKEFARCGPTAKFILLINNAFDILNSHKISDFDFKQAACQKNIESIKKIYDEFVHYINNLHFTDGTPVLHSQRKTGFVGLLMGLKALLGMYDEYIVKGHLKFIPTYKLNQDHLELFFGTVRSQGGYNNNPTCRQFTAAYKKILIHSEIREGGAGNCIPLENINILNVSLKTKPPEQIINESVPNRSDNENSTEVSLNNFLRDHSYAFAYDSLSPYCLEVITYIAGFIAFKLGRKLQCEHCVSQLFGNKEDFLNSLINIKSRGGLSFPSFDVIEICKKTEMYIKREQNCNKKINKNIVALKVLNHFLNANIFENMIIHDLNPLENHKVLLIKCICNCYLTTRIHYICKNAITDEKICTLYTKLILFKGQ